MKKPNFRQGGFTLVEMIFVLAIVLVLVAIFLPLATSQISTAKTTRVQSDEDALSAALTAFFSDLGIWPAANTTVVSGSSPTTSQTLHFLLVGDGGPTITSFNPTDVTASTLWVTAQACPDGTTTNKGSVQSGVAPTGTCATKQNAFNHLAFNDPNTNGTSNSSNDYKTTGSKKWKGPYIAKLAADAYGNNYVVNIGAITGSGTSGSTEFGWIISSGPNSNLDTNPTAAVISSDDIGYIFCTNCQ